MAEWLARWPEHHPGAPSAVAGYTDHVRRYLTPRLGHLLLAEVSVAHVEKMFAVIPREHQEAGRRLKAATLDLDTAALDADYWYRNLREPVRFDAVTRALLERGHEVFVEASPHPVLVMGMEETIADADAAAVAIGSLHRGRGGPDDFLGSVAQAHVGGVPVAWDALLGRPGNVRTALPSYAFQRRRYWQDPATPSGDALAKAGCAAAGTRCSPPRWTSPTTEPWC